MRDRAQAAGGLAAVLWLLLCVRWFDAAAAWRPRVLDAIPPIVLAGGAALGAAFWLRSRWPGPSSEPGDRAGLLLMVAAAILFRLPLAWQGSAGAVTPDGALSGIVSLHVRDGIERLVFVPHVPYSGSLKSHLAAPLAAAIDPGRAFALVSVFFYAAFVAAVFRLALLVPGASRVARAAALYLVFAPAFVTRYSVSNDGNYVEVLAFGTWALWLAALWARELDPRARTTLALVAGLLLGLGFWCHILAVIHVAAVGLALLVFGGLRAWPSIGSLAAGGLLGYAPGLLWNAGNHWGSFQYLLPGGPAVGASEGGPGLSARALGMVTDQWPVLLGYDLGYGPFADRLFLAFGWAAVGVTLLAVTNALRLARRSAALLLLLLFAAVNLAVALVALPHIPGNPRYLLFLMAPLPVLLAVFLDHPRRRWALAALIAFGALGSLAQLPGTVRADLKWRSFVAALEAEGVRYCYTDFYLATKINFLSAERVQCSGKLGPTTTEYFFDYRRRVEAAPEAAFVAVNPTAAGRLERRLGELGVTYERLDLMKPVLLRLSRKVEPEELFPGRDFPWR